MVVDSAARRSYPVRHGFGGLVANATPPKHWTGWGATHDTALDIGRIASAGYEAGIDRRAANDGGRHTRDGWLGPCLRPLSNDSVAGQPNLQPVFSTVLDLHVFTKSAM